MSESSREIEDLLAGYALGALEPEEQQKVKAHLSRCPDCKASLADYQSISDGLLHVLPARQPPGRLRARLIARIAPRGPAITWKERFGAVSLPRIATAVGFFALLIFNLALLRETRVLTREHQALAEQVQADQTVLGLTSYPTAEQALVRGEAGYGSLIYEADLEVAVLYAWGLDPLPMDKTYQAWLIEEDGNRIDAGIFQVMSDTGFVRLIIPSPEPLGAFIGFGVTVEPAGGSQAPTGQRVMGTDL